ncbi:MAG: spermidine synthase [Coriobacteriia bacterium]
MPSDAGRILAIPAYEHNSGRHRLKVVDHENVRSLKFERNYQSSMSLSDPYATDIEYVGYLHLTLAIKPDARRTLAIGLGGGTIVKQMWRDYPGMRIDAVEIDPEVVEVARAYFALPEDERIGIYLGDGREFLEYGNDTYDIIVVDAFEDDRVPRQLLTEEFLREARSHLSHDGVIAYNYIGALHGGASRGFRSLYRTVSNVWRQVWVFRVNIGGWVGDTSNIILLATDRREPYAQLEERIASRVGGLVRVPGFERFAEDVHLEGIRTGDVPILADERPAKPRKRK